MQTLSINKSPCIKKKRADFVAGSHLDYHIYFQKATINVVVFMFAMQFRISDHFLSSYISAENYQVSPHFDKQAEIIVAFNLKSSYLEELLNTDNPSFLGLSSNLST